MKEKIESIFIYATIPILFLIVILMEEKQIEKKLFNGAELACIKKYSGEIKVRVPGSLCTWIVDTDGNGIPDHTNRTFGVPRRGFFTTESVPSEKEIELFNNMFNKL